MSVVLTALRKDLLLQWRGRAQIVAVCAFGAAALLLFSFAVGPDSVALRQHAGGFLWLALSSPPRCRWRKASSTRLPIERWKGCCSCPSARERSTSERRSPTGRNCPWSACCCCR